MRDYKREWRANRRRNGLQKPVRKERSSPATVQREIPPTPPHPYSPMGLYDALKVAEVISQADGSCPYCVAILIGHANQLMPAFDWKRLVKLVNPRALEFPDEEAVLQQFGNR